jgi:hypothetical protein
MTKSDIPVIDNAFNSQNVLFKRIKRASRLPDLVTMTLVSSVLMIVGGVFVGAFLANHVTQFVFGSLKLSSSNPLTFGVFQGLWLTMAALPVVMLLWGWTHFYEKRKLRSLGLSTQNMLLKLLVGAGVGLAIVALAVLLLSLLGFVKFGTGNALTNRNTLIGALVPLVGLLAQAIAQEVIYRGWMLPVIGSRYNWRAGVALSALLYGVFHIFILQNPIDLINLALLGLFLALYALQEGSIWGCIAFQTIWLWSNNNLIGFPAQLQLPVTSTFFKVTPVSSAWLSVGSLGLRGSPVLTLVLVTAIFTLWLINYYRYGQYASPDSLAAAGRLREYNSRISRRSRR